MSANLQFLHGFLISYSSCIKGLNYVIASGKLGVVTYVHSMATNGVLTGSQWQCDQRRGMSPYLKTTLLHLSPATFTSSPMSVDFSARNTGGQWPLPKHHTEEGWITLGSRVLELRCHSLEVQQLICVFPSLWRSRGWLRAGLTSSHLPTCLSVPSDLRSQFRNLELFVEA